MKFPVSVTEKCFHRRYCCVVKTHGASAAVDKTNYSEIESPVIFVLMFKVLKAKLSVCSCSVL